MVCLTFDFVEHNCTMKQKKNVCPTHVPVVAWAPNDPLNKPITGTYVCEWVHNLGLTYDEVE